MTKPETRKATSKDGTTIAYTQIGQGPPIILVDGAFCYREFGPMPKLAPLLAERFTVVYYDRRGRGESTDTKPYAVEREIEDIRALMDAVGGSASLVGLSSGAALAMRAAASGLAVRKLVVYEPPFAEKGAPGPLPPDRMAEIKAHVAAGRRSDAVKTFMRMVGVPAIMIPLMRLIPGVWSKLVGVAHTLPYDFAALADASAERPLPKELSQAMASIKAPTLALLGGKSPPYMGHAVKIVATTVPGARMQTLDKQTHNVAPKPLAAAVTGFM
jgi:pimeloyl-ACP methyl ester carboxylesterase